MRTLVAVPIARAENAVRVTALHAAQTVASTLLFAPAPGVALTGPTCKSTRTIGEARNVALEVARANDYDVVIFWDDDNYYGPAYVADTIEAFERDRPAVVYRGLGFVRHDDGLWQYDDTRTEFYPGHCTAVDPRQACEFPEASYAEDVAWSRRMQAHGRSAVRLGPWGLVYDRRAPAAHAYNAEREVFLRQHGPARFLGAAPDMIVDTPFASAAPWQCASDDDIFAAMRRTAGAACG